MTGTRIITGQSDTDYHRSPALSSSGARLILRSPAHYRWAMDHPTTSQTFNLGYAVHSLVLGSGRQVVMLEADDYRSKEARERRDVYLAADMIPLTRPEWQQVRAMADAVLSHPLAAALFTDGQPELSLFTYDDATGVELRTRPDWIGSVIVDLKTTVNANPADFDRIAWTYHYEQQAAWYIDEVARAGIMPDEDRLLFVNVEKSPPYLVSVTELDAEALRIGRTRNREAIDTFARCLATDEWPGYPAVEHLVPLPTYAAMQYAEEMY